MQHFTLMIVEWPAIAGHFSFYGFGALWLLFAVMVGWQIGHSAELTAVRSESQSHKTKMPAEENGMLLFFAPSEEEQNLVRRAQRSRR
jgi:hypothetical protein